MCASRKEMSDDLKEVIVKLYCENKSLSAIRKMADKARNVTIYK